MIIEYSIVIPCYNSSASLLELAIRIKKVFLNLGSSYEIIFINDCSPNPNTWEAIRNLADEDQNVRAINLTRNFGQQAASICGFSYSRGQYIITMDDDLQHAPEDIPYLIEMQNHDMVIAKFIDKKDNSFNQLTSKIKSYFDYLILGKPRFLRLSPFRLIKESTVSDMLKIKTPTPFISALMFYVSKDAVNVEITHHHRFEGTSNYNFKKRWKLFTLIVINNSSFFLKMIGYLGIISAFFSFILIGYFVFTKIFSSSPPAGWTSTFSAILFFGGMTLFSVGLIGEYLIRIMPVIENRPAYLVREIYEKKE